MIPQARGGGAREKVEVGVQVPFENCRALDVSIACVNNL
jgi:hypothetical protein